MRWLVAAALCRALVAHAQPVMTPSPCVVDFVRAPDDVREVIEAALADLAQCAVALEVRIVPTEAGQYVIARDDRGIVHDRVVPDARSAAVLVASWADGGTPPPLPVRVEVVAPGDTPPPPPVAAPRQHTHWLSAYIAVSSKAHGVQGEVDLLAHDGFTFGIGLERNAYEPAGTMAFVYGQDTVGRVYAAYPIVRGGWQLRPAVGFGVAKTTSIYLDNTPPHFGTGSSTAIGSVYEGSVQLAYSFGGALALSAGLLVAGHEADLQTPAGPVHPSIVTATMFGLRLGFL